MIHSAYLSARPIFVHQYLARLRFAPAYQVTHGRRPAGRPEVGEGRCGCWWAAALWSSPTGLVRRGEGLKWVDYQGGGMII